MTILPLDSRCALTNEPIAPGAPCFSTSGDFLPKSDPLSKYCGKPMNWEAYRDWSERARFARAYVETWVKTNRKNPFWWQVHLDDAVYVSANPQRGIEEASVRLFEVGDDIRVPLPRWNEWLTKPTAVTPGLASLELEALERVLPMLRDRYPDGYAVVEAIDASEKKPGGRG